MNFPSRRSPCLFFLFGDGFSSTLFLCDSARRLAQALKEAAAREQEQAAKAAGGGRSSFQV
tara:strand:- start:57 stop:239 length:183 start_codon:yes stop_codon:yes gene_type:complete